MSNSQNDTQQVSREAIREAFLELMEDEPAYYAAEGEADSWVVTKPLRLDTFARVLGFSEMQEVYDINQADKQN